MRSDGSGGFNAAGGELGAAASMPPKTNGASDGAAPMAFAVGASDGAAPMAFANGASDGAAPMAFAVGASDGAAPMAFAVGARAPVEGSGAPVADRPSSTTKHHHLPALLLCLLLPLLDLIWNLTHLNIGLEDFYGLASFAQAASRGHWPVTPYFPEGYPLLLTPWGLLGEAVKGQGLLGHGVLLGGYVYSAIGIGLALSAVYRVSIMLGLGRWLGLLMLVLGWLASPTRIIAGSPSVDALYTGLGLWFLVAAFWYWRAYPDRTVQAVPGWVHASLACGLLIPFLRHHAVVLIYPIALILLLLLMMRRDHASPVLRRSLGICLWSVAVYAIVCTVFRPLEATAETGQLQVLTGLELRHHRLYADDRALWDNYGDFAEIGRSTAGNTEYGPADFRSHVTSNWWDYLRRAPIVLALALWIPCLLLRRQIPHGVSILCLWVCLYCLALSPAYYTERAAALPLLVALPLVPLLGRALRQIAVKTQDEAEQSEGPLMLLVMVLLLLGLAWQGKTAWQDFQTRSYYARASRELDSALDQRAITRKQVMVLDSRLLPLRANPWCEPYRNVYGSWLDDPAIPPALRAAIPPKLNNRNKVAQLSSTEQRDVLHVILIDWPTEEQLQALGGDLMLQAEQVPPYFVLIHPAVPAKVTAQR